MRGPMLRCMRDTETIDSELRLLVAIRRPVWEAEGPLSSTTHIDELLDERVLAAAESNYS